MATRPSDWLALADGWPSVALWHRVLADWEELEVEAGDAEPLVQEMNLRLQWWPSHVRSLWLEGPPEEAEPDFLGWHAAFLTSRGRELLALVRTLACSPRTLGPALADYAGVLGPLEHWTVLLPWNPEKLKAALPLIPTLRGLTFTANLSGDGTWTKREKRALLSFASATDAAYEVRIPQAWLSAEEARGFLASPLALHARGLGFMYNGIDGAALEGPWVSQGLSRLETLDLDGASSITHGHRLHTLLRQSPGIRELSLAQLSLDSRRTIDLLSSVELPRLVTLSLAANQIHGDFLEWLTTSPLASTIERLDLRRSGVVREEAESHVTAVQLAGRRMQIWIGDDAGLDSADFIRS